jgi:hypothetical protein
LENWVLYFKELGKKLLSAYVLVGVFIYLKEERDMRTQKNSITLFCIIALFLMSSPALAVPPLINYQGMLSDTTGNPVADGQYSMTFKLYSVLTGGTVLWSEAQSVQVNGGVYHVQLGTNPAFPTTLFDNDDLFLEVIITGETLTPRQQVTSTAFAMRGGVKNNSITSAMIQSGACLADILANDGAGSNLDADMLDGNHAAAFATAGHTHADLESRIAQLETTVAQLTALLQSVNRNGNDIFFDGVNVHVRNGSGNTETTNGTGNLIVGYNELRGSGDTRTGSHNLVVGKEHNFSSYGGLVAGIYSSVSGPYASVSGGSYNTASGLYSSVSGGYSNTASGWEASVSGGRNNTASEEHSSVSGGFSNTASSLDSSVSGGSFNMASGGQCNVSGGYSNTASGQYSSVSGGTHNTASSQDSSVSGGSYNTASGPYSSVSGGDHRSVSGNYDWAAGALFQDY